MSYSDNDRSSVVKNNIDNSVRVHNDNDTTTTVTNTSIDSHDNNSINNSFNKTLARADNDEDNDNDLEISCRVSDTRVEEGDYVTYEVRINDGKSPYEIDWSGDISGDDDEERVRYNRSGTYEVSVTVEDDNGDEDEADCPDVRVEDEDEDDEDRVIVTTSTNRNTGNLASLDSVFLSQVPYTGPGDVAKVLGIIAVVIVWSAVVAMWLKNKRAVKTISSKISAFKEQNKNSSKIA